jgi:aconitate hydratase
LKKQGILPLTFVNPADYEKIQEGDTVSLEYIQELDPVRTVNMSVHHTDGSTEIIPLQHSLNLEQLSWFHAGSALNLLRMKEGGSSMKNGLAKSEEIEAMQKLDA